MSVDCLSPHLHNCCHLHCFHLQPNVILQRPADICFTVCNCRVHKLTDPNLLPDKQFSICGKSHTHSIACFGLLLLSSQSAHSQAEISSSSSTCFACLDFCASASYFATHLPTNSTLPALSDFIYILSSMRITLWYWAAWWHSG